MPGPAPPVIRANSTLDQVEIGCGLRASQNDGGFRAVWEQFAGRFAGVAGVATINHAAGHQHEGFRGVQGCNPSSPSPQTPRPGTPAPHTVKSNFLSVTSSSNSAPSMLNHAFRSTPPALRPSMRPSPRHRLSWHLVHDWGRSCSLKLHNGNQLFHVAGSEAANA